MNLKVNKEHFISRYLNPVSKINNSAVLKVTGTGVSTLLSAADNTAILYAQYNKDIDIQEDTILNLPDVSRLIKIVQCITDEDIELEIKNNVIQYSSDEMRFKYHLLEDGILASTPISVEKIKNLKYNTTLTIPFSSIISLIKSASFTIDVTKVYILTQGDSVYAEVGDKQMHNVDSITIKLCDGYKGDSIDEPLPVSLETIRILAGSRCQSVQAFINSELNVMTFEVNNDDIKLTYIISGLIK